MAENPESPCCARCRRGIKAFGLLPCGYNRDCPCHHQGKLIERATNREVTP